MKQSILHEELSALLLRLGEPKMLRFDQGELYGRAMLAEVEALERDGLLRCDDVSGLIYNTGPRPDLGILWLLVANRLRSAGWKGSGDPTTRA